MPSCLAIALAVIIASWTSFFISPVIIWRLSFQRIESLIPAKTSGAPFVTMNCLPFLSLTMMLIIFLAESKGNSLRTWYWSIRLSLL
ncbi:Uncharacterised protein [Mycobacteroides abscessus subsp. abscessus]|nr:Uncharacterised protein [Mycobacteroides abscessus subsp. abscessus]